MFFGVRGSIASACAWPLLRRRQVAALFVDLYTPTAVPT
jgi:hypothetical protein